MAQHTWVPEGLRDAAGIDPPVMAGGGVSLAPGGWADHTVNLALDLPP